MTALLIEQGHHPVGNVMLALAVCVDYISSMVAEYHLPSEFDNEYQFRWVVLCNLALGMTGGTTASWSAEAPVPASVPSVGVPLPPLGSPPSLGLFPPLFPSLPLPPPPSTPHPDSFAGDGLAAVNTGEVVDAEKYQHRARSVGKEMAITAVVALRRRYSALIFMNNGWIELSLLADFMLADPGELLSAILVV